MRCRAEMGSMCGSQTLSSPVRKDGAHDSKQLVLDSDGHAGELLLCCNIAGFFPVIAVSHTKIKFLLFIVLRSRKKQGRFSKSGGGHMRRLLKYLASAAMLLSPLTAHSADI